MWHEILIPTGVSSKDAQDLITIHNVTGRDFQTAKDVI